MSRSPVAETCPLADRQRVSFQNRIPNMPPPKSPHWILRRADQAAIAGLVLFSLAGIAAWVVYQNGLRQRMIEVDRTERQYVQFQVDVNSAEVPELIQLPGVGETLASRIVESRNREGPYADLDDLRRVHGIGQKTMERIRPYLLPMPDKANMAKRTDK
jgi:competence protein ComEA